jgi:hypothetical protein
MGESRRGVNADASDLRMPEKARAPGSEYDAK